MKIFVVKPVGFRKLSHSSEMQNDAFMHREGLKGLIVCFYSSSFEAGISNEEQYLNLAKIKVTKNKLF